MSRRVKMAEGCTNMSEETLSVSAADYTRVR